jgi:hypothetical protein
VCWDYPTLAARWQVEITPDVPIESLTPGCVTTEEMRGGGRVVGLVFVSDSARLAKGLRDLITHIQSDVPVRAAGGMPDERCLNRTHVLHLS